MNLILEDMPVISLVYVTWHRIKQVVEITNDLIWRSNFKKCSLNCNDQ